MFLHDRLALPDEKNKDDRKNWVSEAISCKFREMYLHVSIQFKNMDNLCTKAIWWKNWNKTVI